MIYRNKSYRDLLSRYHMAINRQMELLKLTPKEELFGREASPAKQEYQVCYSQAVLLKKDIFRVSTLGHSVATALLLKLF